MLVEFGDYKGRHAFRNNRANHVKYPTGLYMVLGGDSDPTIASYGQAMAGSLTGRFSSFRSVMAFKTPQEKNWSAVPYTAEQTYYNYSFKFD